MDSMLATEGVSESNEKQATAPVLETWARNERMRHIPSLEWMDWKLEVDVRRRLDKMLNSFRALDAHDPRYASIEEHFRAVIRAIDRFADVARHSRNASQPPADLSSRVGWSISHAVSNLRTNDRELIGRRFPFHTFERSKSEPLYAALLAVLCAVDRLVPLVREIDSRLDERLLDGLVVLSNPVDDRMLKPIAQ